MSKAKKDEGAASSAAVATDASAHGTHKAGGALLPLPLWIAFVAVVAVGLVLFVTQDTRAEKAALSALRNCDASVRPVEDGLKDEYGVINIKQNATTVADYMSLCDLNPDLALKVYRASVGGSNKSATLVALYSTIFLAPRLNNDDIQAIAKILATDTEETKELRRTAQRTLSDLTVIERVQDASKLEAIPDGISKKEGVGPHKIQTREEKLRDKTYLNVRWSNPDLAGAWWKVNAANGKWDTSLQRFVIP